MRHPHAYALVGHVSRECQFSGFLPDVHLLHFLDNALQGMEEQLRTKELHCNLPVRWLLRPETLQDVAKQPPALLGGGGEADGGQRYQSVWPSRFLVYRLETPHGQRPQHQIFCSHDSIIVARA